MKTIYLVSLGCAKNQVDSEILLTIAKEQGYLVVEDPALAQIIVINSCGFIESAKMESINTVLSYRNNFPKAKIILAGCLAQRYINDLEMEEADVIFGNHDLNQFPTVLKRLEAKEKDIKLAPEYPDPDRERDDRSILLSLPRSAYLKISEGCNHRCNYCAIPIIRGPLRSRPKAMIIEEAKRLIAKGIYEINVIAQDLGAYGTDLSGESQFCDLIETLAQLDGNFVLRMLYIHPDTFPRRLISIVKNNKKILPYFDIPFQHADPTVLKGMKRTGNPKIYLGLINEIRSALPEAVIRSTIMLGFPGEDRAAFNTLISFIKEAKLDWMGSFLYSREEDTVAYDMRGEREHNKAHKLASLWQKELEAEQSKITEAQLQRFVSHSYDALVEELIENEDLAIARIYSQAPEVDGSTVIMGRDMKVGDIVKVGIRMVRGVDLEAVKV